MAHKSFRIVLLLFCALFLLSSVPGCDKKGDEESEEEKMEPLPEAPNGSPLAVEFVSLEGNDIDARVFNHGEDRPTGYVILARYYDSDGNLLKVKPGTNFEAENDFTSVSGGKYGMDSGEGKELTFTMMEIPEGAASAQLLISKVDGKSGELFSQDDWGQWPEGVEGN